MRWCSLHPWSFARSESIELTVPAFNLIELALPWARGGLESEALSELNYPMLLWLSWSSSAERGFFPPSHDTEIKDAHAHTHTHTPPSMWKPFIAVWYMLWLSNSHTVSSVQDNVSMLNMKAFVMKSLLWSACEQKAQGWRGSPVLTSVICQFKAALCQHCSWTSFTFPLCVLTQLYFFAAGIFLG